jgi:pSer/pThr/pTyr-binding forkhead associated (FHA) protein
VVLADATVSKLHAHLRVLPEHVELIDHHSKNGTRVNGRPVAPDQPVVVQSGSVVHFGNLATALLDAESLYEQL